MLPTIDDEPTAHVERRSDALLALIAAAATVCFAWSGFQSAEWVRERFLDSDEAAALSEQSLEISAEADRLEERDTLLYVEWLIALRAGDQDAADAIFSLFRPETQAYINEVTAGGEDDVGDPFTGPQYDVNEKRAEAAALDVESRNLSEQSREASQNGARYGGLGLLFASILAVAGIASRFRVGRTRRFMLGFATALLIVGLIGLALSPVSFISA